MNYPLQDAELAIKWYRTQAEFYAPMTRSFLQTAGITAGMQVLDVGSGGGDLSLLLAEMVGPQGGVLGIDMSAEAIDQATARVSALGVQNVTFLREDASRVSLGKNFDAIVGRFILMYFKNPSAVVSTLARCAKPNGLIVFIEPDYSGVRSSENVPFFEHIGNLIERALELAGADTRMGLKLHRVFMEARLARPTLQLAAAIGGGPDFAGYELAAGFMSLLLPSIEKFGLANSDDLDPGTLVHRLRNEVVESGGVVVFPSLIAACARMAGDKFA